MYSSKYQYMFHLYSGNTACLPGWKHDKDLTEVTGTGAAPDGDEDAIAGMIMAVKVCDHRIYLTSIFIYIPAIV